MVLPKTSKTDYTATTKSPRKTTGSYIGHATSSEAARNVEKAFLDNGCDGGTGGGDDDAVYVYAYLKASVTEP